MISAFQQRELPDRPDVMAPDGSEVRVLAATAGGSMAHFTLGARQVSKAMRHLTVEEVWFFLTGRGRMALKGDGDWQVVAVSAGSSLSIPLGWHFQFRNDGDGPLAAVAVTMPPWPLDREEAVPVDGLWEAVL